MPTVLPTYQNRGRKCESVSGRLELVVSESATIVEPVGAVVEAPATAVEALAAAVGVLPEVGSVDLRAARARGGEGGDEPIELRLPAAGAGRIRRGPAGQQRRGAPAARRAAIFVDRHSG